MTNPFLPLDEVVRNDKNANLIFAFQVYVHDDGNVNSEYWWTPGFYHIVDSCPHLNKEMHTLKDCINSSVEDAWQGCKEKFIEEIDQLLQH